MSVAIAAIAVIAVLLAIVLSGKRYHRSFLKYDPAREQHYDFRETAAVFTEVTIEANGIAWPAGTEGWDTAFLEVNVQSTWTGPLRDPYIETRSGTWKPLSEPERFRCCEQRWHETASPGLRHSDHIEKRPPARFSQFPATASEIAGPRSASGRRGDRYLRLVQPLRGLRRDRHQQRSGWISGLAP